MSPQDNATEDYLAHYGIKRRSGRYPWGSGGTELSRSRQFIDWLKSFREQGLTDTEIARGVGLSLNELRATNSIAKNVKKNADIALVRKYQEKGMSNVEIGLKMGRNESSIRALMASGVQEKADILMNTANMLKREVGENGLIDVGSGVSNHLGVSETRLKNAVAVLQSEGYRLHPVKILQQGTGQMTELKVLCPPGTTQKEAWMRRNEIKQVSMITEDRGRTFKLGIMPPISVSQDRLAIKYQEDGGDKADGVIYVRPGKADLSLGANQYAQVRIAVDGTHYIKGMAMYKADLPRGTDLQFNTNKKKADLGSDKLAALKKMERNKDGDVDADFPFGSIVRQQMALDKDGKEYVTSAMNIVNDQGQWEKWNNNLSSQMLSKQSTVLARQQLDKRAAVKEKELAEIMALTNPVVKKRLLESFADDADSSAVHLKAAAIDRQGTHVILPINTLKDTEIYAPKYNQGERVALIRYPHGGTFEIPELIVNNNHKDAKAQLGDAQDAVGINSKVAARLSGADFDGDTVLVIPNGTGRVKSTPALEKLKGFDPQSSYPGYEGMPKMSSQTKQTQMGVVSNLITDMTIRGAPAQEIARAVKHSMVVIDAEKHNLNWRLSEADNGISALKAKYQTPFQPSGKAGASTLISRAKGPKDVPERKQGYRIDPATGKKIYTPTNATKVVTKVSKRTGAVTSKVVPKTQTLKKLEVVDDAFKLSSGTKIETVYANHSNRLKAMADNARKTAVNIKPPPKSPSAAKTYAKEVTSLNAKLDLAIRNRPQERQAQIIAAGNVAAVRANNPNMEKSEIKKIQSLALKEARLRMNAAKPSIEISPSEWAAIQAGAISPSRLDTILKNTDVEVVKTLATPKTPILMTSSKTRRAEALLAGGSTQAEVAAILGVSLTTLKNTLNQ